MFFSENTERLAMCLVDETLSMIPRNSMKRCRLQLLGIACLCVATKAMEETYLDVEQASYLCMNLYSPEEVAAKEANILEMHDFDILYDLSRFMSYESAELYDEMEEGSRR